ncbi:MAG: toxin, RelE family [Verrucomicrobiales bacterium]|nr:toxin, RelE family [Verrucomicrobiales bacterium]
MSRIVHLPAADIDIQNAYEYYENLLGGRGVLFLMKLNSAYETINRFPESGRIIHGTHRRFLISNFPYAIYYTPYAERIIVAAILDVRQRPEMIRRRLK